MSKLQTPPLRGGECVSVITRLAIFLVILAACSCSRPTSSAPSADTLQAAAKADVPLKRLDLTYEKHVVGAKVRAVASDLPAGKTVDLKWSTVTGGWVIEDYYYFRGKKYSETTTSLGKFPVDSKGGLDARFAILEDYDGCHDFFAKREQKPLAD